MASILLAVCLLLAFVAPAEGAVQLPPGFVHTRVVFLVGPVGIAFAPDGALWIAQGAGAEGMGVCVYRGGVLTQALSLPNTQVGDRGIHAIAVDPDYLQNGWIWIYYTVADPPRNRLSHFTNVGDTLQNEVVVVEGPPTSSAFHNGGCLAFASDRTLYLGMGDDSQGSTTAQDRFDLRGKILHINRDGTPAWDNPYANASGGDPRVWAWGLRNPYRCSVQPETDNLFIGDVGESQWEEIDMGVAGGNFGWASVEGAAPGGVPGFVYPIHRYLHDHASGSSVIAGKHVPSGVFDSSYEGNYFFADWSRSEIHRLVLDASHNVVSAETWANVANGPTDLAFGPDGALYYAAEAGAGVFRISYVGGSNHQPGAVATAGPQGGPAPLVVRFDGSGSSDADGDPLVYSWDFGDGSQMPSGPSVLTHS